jgi:hypothetical protein
MTGHKYNNPQRKDYDNHIIQRFWRPMMAWMYGIVCLWDFLLAPIFFAWYAYFTHTNLVVWVPLTTQGGGLFHLSMGAIVGVNSYSKTQERVAITNNQSSNSFGQSGGLSQFNQPSGFGQSGQVVDTTTVETFSQSGSSQQSSVNNSPLKTATKKVRPIQQSTDPDPIL